MKIVKMIIQWALVALLAICALAWCPSLSSLLFLLGAIILLPVKAVEQIMEKVKLDLVTRIVIAVILLVIGFVVTPKDAPPEAEKDRTQTESASSDTKDDKKDDGNNSKKEDNPDSKNDDQKDSSKDDRTDSKKDDKKDDSKDDRTDSKKDDKKDSGNDDIKTQIIGMWHYGWPIDCYFEFYEDGTWEMDSDGGTWNQGTYEIKNGKTIKMKGETGDHTFTIKNANELSDEDGETLTPFSRSDDDFDESYDDRDDYYDSAQVSRHPVFTVEEFGNFKKINTSVFETSIFSPEVLVGRWYEDGWLEGYYLELYGNGTWKYFGEDERNGYYSIASMLFKLEESEFGICVGQPTVFYDEDAKAYQMSFTLTGPEAFKTRTDPEGFICFWREDCCRHCDDLDAYYEEKYPYKELAGDWYPVGDHSGECYYSITAEAHWSEVLGHVAGEVGILEDNGDGSFTSEGGTWEELKTFEMSDDGYLYIDGDAYEKVESGPEPPNRSLGTFCYENGDGYIFYEDWTFESVPGSSFDEHGTFLFVGDNVLLYDDDGYRLHVFYQNEFMDWDGKSIDEAWRRQMENRDDSELNGEIIFYQLPAED